MLWSWVGVGGVVVFNTPNSKGNACDSRVMTGCGVNRVSANSILHKRVGGKARLNGVTGKCVSGNRLVPSRLVVSVLTGACSALPTKRNIVFSNFPHAVTRTRTLGGVLTRHGRSVNVVVRLMISRRALVTHLLGHTVRRKHTSSGRRAVEGHFRMCRDRATPLTR